MRIDSLRPNQKRANTATMLIYIVMASTIVLLIANISTIFMLNWRMDGTMLSNELVMGQSLFIVFAAAAYTIFYIISVVTFIMWFRRAYYNMNEITHQMEYGDGWAAGAWFVPILNLFRPYQMMKELHIKANKALQAGNSLYVRYSPQHLGTWWTLWVITNVISNAKMRISFRADTIEEELFAAFLGVLTAILGIPLALVTVKVIKNYSLMEEQLDEIYGSESDNKQPIDSNTTASFSE